MQQRGGVATAFWRGNILHVSNMYLMVHQPRSEAGKMYSNSPSDWASGHSARLSMCAAPDRAKCTRGTGGRETRRDGAAHELPRWQWPSGQLMPS